MRSRRFILVCGLLLFIVALCVATGCKPSKVAVNDVTPITIPATVETKPVQLYGIRSTILPGTQIGRASVTDILADEEIFLQQAYSPDNLVIFFYETLKAYGYKVAGDPNAVFTDSGSPEIMISSIIKALDLHAQYGFSFNNTKGDISATIQVEWQLVDVLTKQLLYTTTTQGAVNTTFYNDDYTQAVADAYQNAVLALLADKRFYELVTGDNTSGPRRTTDTSADMSAYKYTVASSGDRRTMAEVQQSVVTVDMGFSHGSGFVLSNNGLVITNHHVVGTYSEAYVVAHDGTKYKGTVVARDAGRDVAAIVVPDLPLKPLKVRVSTVELGEDVYAVGSPKFEELYGTVTKGIVSSVNRSFANNVWIQSDATINSGNSGGALVDSKGNVVGISTASVKESESLHLFIPIVDGLNTLNIQRK